MISVDFWRSRLGRKIVAMMIAGSAVLSVGATGVQLYLAYERDRARVFDELAIIEDSFRDGLESALWTFNFDQVNVLLDGIFAQHDIVYLRLITPTGNAWERGKPDEEDLILTEFELAFRGKPDKLVPVGNLTAGLSLEFVQTRIWEQFWAFILSNFIKTLLASIVMLAIFDRLAGRHLRAISDQASAEWLDTNEMVAISRAKTENSDELDDIVGSLNHARASVRASHAELSDRIAELGILNSKLSDANREQSEFTYAISHDLKSPTNTVKMLLRELRESNNAALDNDSVEILDDLDVTVARMGQFVDDVLVYARSIGEEMSVETVNLTVEVEAIIRDLSGDIADAGADVRTGELPTVTGNAVQLRLLMQNLISNAIKFHDPVRQPVVEIESTPGQKNGWIAVSVRDNGIGIDEKHLDRIFGLFKRLHNYAAYQGSGIGLTVCQRIVSNHGGKIEVSSSKWVGSKFTVLMSEKMNGTQN